MWKAIKPYINKIVVLSTKTHWILVFFLVAQYLTGEMLAEPGKWGINLEYSFIVKIHSLNAKLLLVSGIYLALTKLYLYLNRKGKI